MLLKLTLERIPTDEKIYPELHLLHEDGDVDLAATSNRRRYEVPLLWFEEDNSDR